MQTNRSAPNPSDQLDAAKWLALVLMTASHAMLAFNSLREIGYWLGRPALPLFAGIIAIRLSDGGTDRSQRYLLRLLAWGLLTQPVYQQLLVNFADRLNIMFALAAGVGIWAAVERRLWLGLVAAAAGLSCARANMEYGGIFPFALAVSVPIAKRFPLAAVALVTSATALTDFPDPANSRMLVLLAVTKLPVIAVFQLAMTGRIPVPRLPGWLFYTFYPVQFAVVLWLWGPYLTD